MITFMHEHKDLYGHITTEITYTTHAEGLDEVVDDFRNFLLATGFHPDSIKKYIEEN